jgi:hypothetical protein
MIASTAAQCLFPVALLGGNPNEVAADSSDVLPVGTAAHAGLNIYNITSGSSDDGVATNGISSEDKELYETAVAACTAFRSSGSKGNGPRQDLPNEWISLLEERLTVNSADEMSAWLFKVISISSSSITSQKVKTESLSNRNSKDIAKQS